MKKNGVIDHFLDQYHFHNYPDWIKNASNGEMQITYAWAETEHEGGKSNAECCAERGPGLFSNYAIHHIEPIVCMIGADIEKIMYIGTKNTTSLIFGYRDGRTAVISQLGWECPFNMAVNYSNGHAALFDAGDNFYAEFIKELVGFFRNGRIRVPHQETLAVMTVLEYGNQAQKNPGEWIFLPAVLEGK